MLGMKRKVLSLIMTAAMVTTMFVGMTITASADTVINSQSDLANATGTGTYVLGQSFSVDASTWTPITFQGTLNGAGKTITWTGTSSSSRRTYNSGYFGLFASNSGIITNLTVGGNLYLKNTGYLTSDFYSAVVAYNNGTINGITNNALFNIESTLAFNIGGISGINKGKIMNSANTGAITGYRKLGGITGENDGTINSCSNSGAVTSSYGSKNGVGGIAGLNGDKDSPTQTGHIWNCYNTANISSGSGSWVGGICGLENALSDCVNCYNTGRMTANGYRDNISGKTEGANYNCYGLPTSLTNAQYYDSATILDELSDMKTDTFLNSISFNATSFWARSTDLPYLTNVATTSSTSPASGITISMYSSPFQTTYNVGDKFNDAGMIIRAYGSDGSVAKVTGYSISKTTALATSDNNIVISGTFNGTAYSFNVPIIVTNPSTIYLDTSASNNGDGSSLTPFNNLTSALNAANVGDKIALMNTVTLNSSTTKQDDVTFIRASGFSGTMFEINPGSGNTVLLTTMRIDGAANGTTTPSGTLFNVTSGTLILRGGIILKNGVTGVNITSNNGTLVVNKAIINASMNSISNTGILTINDFGGTTISGTVYINNSSTFNYGGDGISSDSVVYLNNTNGSSDAYISLTGEITKMLNIECANPTAGTSSTGTRVAEGSSNEITTETLEKMHYNGYTLKRTLSGDTRYIYIAS